MAQRRPRSGPRRLPSTDGAPSLEIDLRRPPGRGPCQTKRSILGPKTLHGKPPSVVLAISHYVSLSQNQNPREAAFHPQKRLPTKTYCKTTKSRNSILDPKRCTASRLLFQKAAYRAAPCRKKLITVLKSTLTGSQPKMASSHMARTKAS